MPKDSEHTQSKMFTKASTKWYAVFNVGDWDGRGGKKEAHAGGGKTLGPVLAQTQSEYVTLG